MASSADIAVLSVIEIETTLTGRSAIVRRSLDKVEAEVVVSKSTSESE